MSHLSEDQVLQFKDQGYLLVKGILNPEDDLDPINDAFNRWSADAPVCA